MDYKKTNLLSTSTIRQAHLASLHIETNAVLPFWSSFGGLIIPKVSIDHHGFAGTMTHTDGDDTEKKTEKYRVHVHNRFKEINKHKTCVCSELKKAGMKTDPTFITGSTVMRVRTCI